MLIPASTIQRRAPLISTPTKSVATTIAALMMKTTSATRRRWCGDRNEVTMRTMTVGIR